MTTDGEYFYFDDTSADDTELDEYQEPAHVLVIDQFEEIFSTHLEHWEHREAFFQQLEEAMLADPLLWVVLVLREDIMSPPWIPTRPSCPIECVPGSICSAWVLRLHWKPCRSRQN